MHEKQHITLKHTAELRINFCHICGGSEFGAKSVRQQRLAGHNAGFEQSFDRNPEQPGPDQSSTDQPLVPYYARNDHAGNNHTRNGYTRPNRTCDDHTRNNNARPDHAWKNHTRNNYSS